jgi:hypothetical protein
MTEIKRKREEKKEQRWCPYCDDAIVNSQLPICQPCRVETFNCPDCGTQVPRTKKVCPKCGSSLKPKA